MISLKEISLRKRNPSHKLNSQLKLLVVVSEPRCKSSKPIREADFKVDVPDSKAKN